RFGDQATYPIMELGTTQQLELHFDDMDADVKYYYYTLEMRNADWSPVQMGYFDYIKGFTQQRINTYRVSSAMLTRYTHYTTSLPDRNMVPTKSGNYLLKVFLNGDTTQLAFTRRILVVDNKMAVATQIQQPFNQQAFRTHHRLLVQVSTKGIDIRYPQQQVKLFALQNFRWDNALQNVPPTFLKQDMLSFVNEQEMLMPAMREWRWLNIRSFRLLGDRVSSQQNTNKVFEVTVQEDLSRVGTPYYFFRDYNGMFVTETVEKINPFWEADYGKVHFSYKPAGGQPYRKELYLFGEISNYGKDATAKMVYNAEKQVYEGEMYLKQGYYDYVFGLYDPATRRFEMDATEGNVWETENTYLVLIYYRELGGRYDQLLGLQAVNSQFARPN
ncbi:MAG: DUF5103 domain-containing protein, partial [Sphingobacteriales bacterium]